MRNFLIAFVVVFVFLSFVLGGAAGVFWLLLNGELLWAGISSLAYFSAIFALCMCDDNGDPYYKSMQ